MLDYKVGDRVVFNKSRFAGGAVYGRNGEVTNRKEPEDFTQYGTISGSSTVPASRYGPAYTVLLIKAPAWKGHKVVSFYECHMGDGYWVRNASPNTPLTPSK